MHFSGHKFLELCSSTAATALAGQTGRHNHRVLPNLLQLLQVTRLTLQRIAASLVILAQKKILWSVMINVFFHFTIAAALVA